MLVSQTEQGDTSMTAKRILVAATAVLLLTACEATMEIGRAHV